MLGGGCCDETTSSFANFGIVSEPATDLETLTRPQDEFLKFGRKIEQEIPVKVAKKLIPKYEKIEKDIKLRRSMRDGIAPL